MNYRGLLEHILLFKIHLGIRKAFFEIYGQFGQAPSYRFANPDVEQRTIPKTVDI